MNEQDETNHKRKLADITNISLLRVCAKTKLHVEGQIVPEPYKHSGQTCTFHLNQMICDLCIEGNRVRYRLVKEGEKPIIQKPKLADFTANITNISLLRVCAKTKFHVEGQIVPEPYKHSGQTCTFHLNRMNCDLCIEGNRSHRLVKEAEIQMIQKPKLVDIKRFIHSKATNVTGQDADFTKDEAIDFILHCFVNGSVKGKGERLTEAERDQHYRILETEELRCFHTGRPLQFFRPGMPDQASPDRLVFVHEKSLAYSNPGQVTVRSCLWANFFFSDETDRDQYVKKLCDPYMNAEKNLLDFDPIFKQMNETIHLFLSTPVEDRKDLNRKEECLVPKSKLQQIIAHLRYNKKMRNDFRNREELESFFKAFRSRCVVSGLDGRDYMMSVDRKVDEISRYNWTQCNPMLWSINAGKASFRLAFESDNNFDLWFQDHAGDYQQLINESCNRGNVDLKEVKETWTVVVEMRKYFCALLQHYLSHGNPKFYHDFILVMNEGN